MFDRKYKVILTFAYPDNYIEMLDWVNTNSNGSVEISLGNYIRDPSIPWYAPAGQLRKTVYVGFENLDDATFFKIKYQL